jgi:DNA-binding CsgD family transcriptional regulator/catechol 2,3-dioxygenase-like lactoylglutathione lyase family enzyme
MTSERKRGRPPHGDVLTPAEWRVVERVRHGLSNPAIARSQRISVDAVKYHLANALAKLGFSSRAEIRRWDGISRDSRLFVKEHDMSQPIALGPIGQVSRHVRDVAAARSWYGDVLGLPHLYSFGNLAFFDCGGTRLFLSEGETPANESILYFRVPDIRAAHAQLGERGVEFVDAPHMIHRHDDGTEEWMAFFNDPDGRPLAIMSQVR